jgi:hypothetical protein
MNGNDLNWLYETLGITTIELADLLGVHATTVYRWNKAAGSEIKMNPLQLQLMRLLMAKARDSGASLGHELLAGLDFGGTLGGLSILLSTFEVDKTLIGTKSRFSPRP